MTFDDVQYEIWKQHRGNRALALQDMIHHQPLYQHEINQLIIDVWEDSENIWQCPDVWEDHWNNYEAPPVKKRLIARLFKEPRVLYRAGNPSGQSWTFDRKVAEFFLMRRVDNKVIHERLVSADEVITITNGRKEKEVILKVLEETA